MKMSKPWGYRPTYCVVHSSSCFYCVLDGTRESTREEETQEKRTIWKNFHRMSSARLCIWNCSFFFSPLWQITNQWQAEKKKRNAWKLSLHFILCHIANQTGMWLCIKCLYDSLLFLAAFFHILHIFLPLSLVFVFSFRKQFKLYNFVPLDFFSTWFDAKSSVCVWKKQKKLISEVFYFSFIFFFFPRS